MARPDFVVAVALSLSAASLAAQTPPECSVTFLGPAQSVNALSETGVVVGQTYVGNATRAWVASAGSPLLMLPLPAGDQSSWALDINEQGVIVGAVSAQTSPEFQGRAAKWLPDGQDGYTVHELGKLSGHSGSVATALNNPGDIVGYSNSGMFRYPVLFSAPGGVLDLNPLGVFDPQSINDQRQMVDKQCKRLDLDTMVVESFGLPPGPISYGATTGYAINELGQIAGTAVLATSTSCVYQAMRHMDDYGFQILSPCSSLAHAHDINDLGDVIYKWNLIYNLVHLEGIGDFSPQQLVPPDAGPWSVAASFNMDINSARQLAVIATDTSKGITGAALLTPIGSCQADLGYGGPGTAQLSACGAELSSGGSAQLTLWGGPEGGSVMLAAGLVAAPTPFKGGTLVPVPILLLVTLPTGPTGTLSATIPGGGGPVSVYVQALYLDPGLPAGFGFSNAVRLDFLP
ncbi:MAG TPA: hypothetical protein VFD43_02185 [Planctomycetota bacterium]|nr:hypothetical protein [Planctomycetota bacterium]